MKSLRSLHLSDEDAHVALVLGLTFATGVVDAVSYFSLDHVFTANMSGNMALLGIGAATDLGDVTGNIFAFVGFVLGSIAIGRLIRTRHGSMLKLFVHGLQVELALLLGLTIVLGAVDVGQHDHVRYAVCLFLASAMGVQTGLARHIAVKDVNTTVATMTLHDLAADSKLAGGESVRWRRRAAVVGCLFFGAAIGVALDQVVSWGGLGLVCVIVTCVLVGTVKLSKRTTVVDA